MTATGPEVGPRRIMPPQRNSRPVVEPQSYRENRYTSPSPTYDARYQRPQAGANHPMAIEAPEGATRRDIQNGGYPAQRLASRPEVGAETPRYSVAPAEAGAGQYQTNSTDLHGAGRYQTSSSGGEYSPYGSAPRQGDSYPPNSDPTNRYQDSTASGYPEAAQRRYQSTPATGSYQSVPSSLYPPSSDSGYGEGASGHGTGLAKGDRVIERSHHVGTARGFEGGVGHGQRRSGVVWRGRLS